MSIRAIYGTLTSVIVLAFLARYIVAERRLETMRTQATINATKARVIPWGGWDEWRKQRIREEFTDDATV